LELVAWGARHRTQHTCDGERRIKKSGLGGVLTETREHLLYRFNRNFNVKGAYGMGILFGAGAFLGAPNSRAMLIRREQHRTKRSGWLRAAVLGANDGILSTASLVLGVTAAHGTHRNVLVAGVAGLVAGGMSMAAGEYVSVHSQADTEKADLEMESKELKADAKGEQKELAQIYVARGLDPALAKQVARQLMAYDALGAHARDELGISKTLRARPIQAALTSAASFAVGAAMPLLVTAMVTEAQLIYFVAGSSLFFLAILGGLAARVGGASVLVGAIRVTFWGALAMAITAGVGAMFGTVT
jgi:VIT1/CCC1 family predicted Fe2+/Mn2+ transporter